MGTRADNVADMISKGRDRKASGDSHGSRTHPERLARGDRNGARLHPERIARGDASGARLHPERLARGDAHHARQHPERLARGDAHYSRIHPERLARGDANGSAKLTEGNIRFIFQLRAQGWTQTRLAAEFGVSVSLIGLILSRKVWAHVELEASP
jgi:hypothetical protein